MCYIEIVTMEHKTKYLNIRIEKSVNDFLEQLAKDFDRPKSYIVTSFIKYFMKNPPKSIPVDKEKTIKY